MEYLLLTKGDGGPLASVQPSRDEAAEFWSALTGADLNHALDLMGDRERAQEGDSHAFGDRRVFVLESPDGEPYPTLLFGERVAELSELEFIPVEEHRTAALQRDAEPAA